MNETGDSGIVNSQPAGSYGGQYLLPKSDRACANVLGVAVDALNLEGALARVADALESNRKGYICAVGVHGILEARRNASMAQALADAAIVVPDGTPTVWVGRVQGCTSIDHVTGPALMREIFRRERFSRYRHFFYGGKEGVAGELARSMLREAPDARIAGICTPPFRELNRAEEDDLMVGIKACKPDIIWVGISTPKQELFMRRMLPRLDTCLMFGVGAAFDFHTGRIRDCAPWIKAAGFQWLHRLLQDPKRLWRRNLRNSTFLWHIAVQLTGFRNYSLPARSDSSLGGYVLAPEHGGDSWQPEELQPISKWVLEPAHKAAQTCSDD